MTTTPDPRAHITELLAIGELPAPVPLGDFTPRELIDTADAMYGELRTEVDDATSATEAATLRLRMVALEQLVAKLGEGASAS